VPSGCLQPVQHRLTLPACYDESHATEPASNAAYRGASAREPLRVARLSAPAWLCDPIARCRLPPRADDPARPGAPPARVNPSHQALGDETLGPAPAAASVSRPAHVQVAQHHSRSALPVSVPPIAAFGRCQRCCSAEAFAFGAGHTLPQAGHVPLLWGTTPMRDNSAPISARLARDRPRRNEAANSIAPSLRIERHIRRGVLLQRSRRAMVGRRQPWFRRRRSLIGAAQQRTSALVCLRQPPR
jgi:hypothetical protein